MEVCKACMLGQISSALAPLDHMLAHTISQHFEIPGLVDYLHRTGSLTAADEQV